MAMLRNSMTISKTSIVYLSVTEREYKAVALQKLCVITVELADGVDNDFILSSVSIVHVLDDSLFNCNGRRPPSWRFRFRFNTFQRSWSWQRMQPAEIVIVPNPNRFLVTSNNRKESWMLFKDSTNWSILNRFPLLHRGITENHPKSTGLISITKEWQEVFITASGVGSLSHQERRSVSLQLSFCHSYVTFRMD